MAEEIAALIKTLSADDFSEKLRSDPVLRVAFQKIYLILRQSVGSVGCDGGAGDDGGGDGCKLGLEAWDQAQINAVACLLIAVVKSVRSLSGSSFVLVVSVFVFCLVIIL